MKVTRERCLEDWRGIAEEVLVDVKDSLVRASVESDKWNAF